uniref:Uncharacterized protein n=1 Tax=Anguilla anguilla TaxID=7936 RepID=A0A0E9Q9V6_ANGAN
MHGSGIDFLQDRRERLGPLREPHIMCLRGSRRFNQTEGFTSRVINLRVAQRYRDTVAVHGLYDVSN